MIKITLKNTSTPGETRSSKSAPGRARIYVEFLSQPKQPEALLNGFVRSEVKQTENAAVSLTENVHPPTERTIRCLPAHVGAIYTSLLLLHFIRLWQRDQ